jgi:hypothetical protein
MGKLKSEYLSSGEDGDIVRPDPLEVHPVSEPTGLIGRIYDTIFG